MDNQTTFDRRSHKTLPTKSLLLAVGFAALVATNIATLVSGSVHDLLYSKLRTVLSVVGNAAADRLTRNSVKATTGRRIDAATSEVKAANRDLEERNRKLTQETQDLGRQNAKLKADHSALQARRVADGKAAKEVAGTVRARLARGVIRNQASLPAEALPYVGIAVTLGVTALDIYDACETMKDINGLLVRLGEGEESADFCGTKLPTREEVLAMVKTKWESSLAKVAEDLKAAPAAMKAAAPLEVRLPTMREALTVVCPVVPSLCS